MAATSNEPGISRQTLPLIACLAICTLGPLSAITQTAMPPVLPKIGEHFSAVPNADALVRLMMTGLSAAMIVGSLASGFLAERFGQLRLLLVCLGIFALTGLASYFVDNLYFLVGMRLVLGAVNAAAGVLGTAIIATRLAGPRRDAWLGYYTMTGAVLSLLWVTLAGVLGAIDWRLIFLLQLLAVPAAVFLALTLPADRPVGGGVKAAAVEGGGIPWGMTLFGLVCGAIGSSVFIYLPFHLHKIGYGDPAKIGPLLTVAAAAGVATALSFGWLRKRLSAIPVFIGGFALTGIGLLLSLSVQNYYVLGVTLAIYSAGFGVITPNIFSACAAATPMALRTRVLGFMRAGFYSGPLVAQPFLEVANQRGGPAGALAALGFAAFVAAGVFVLFRARFAPIPEPTTA